MKTVKVTYDNPHVLSPPGPHAPSGVQSNSKYLRTEEEEE